MRNLGFLLICLLLTACAPGSGPQPEAKTAVSEVPLLELRNELAKIAGAQLEEGEPLLVRFPVGTLFTEGSALPIAGGIAPLDALVGLLKPSAFNWALTVRAASGEGPEYDAELATMRAEIIKTYFKNSGVNLRKLTITVVAEPGAPLELQPISSGD